MRRGALAARGLRLAGAGPALSGADACAADDFTPFLDFSAERVTKFLRCA